MHLTAIGASLAGKSLRRVTDRPKPSVFTHARPDKLSARSFAQTRRGDLSLIEMATTQIEALHHLSVSIGWPHRPSDWLTSLETAQGIAATDDIGRVHGTFLSFPYKDGPDAIGMFIVHPRLRSSDLTDVLARALSERIDGRQAFLNASPTDIETFAKWGARTECGVYRIEGHLAEDMPVDLVTRPCHAEDVEEIIALDHAAYNADRRAVLQSLLLRSTTRVIERRGKVRAFAMRRTFGRGHLIGPVTAERESDAIALVAALLSGLRGQFVRIDTRTDGGRFIRFLRDTGLHAHLEEATMSFGQKPVAIRASAFALSGLSTG